MIVDIYARVSFDRTGEGSSVETQIRSCTKHAEEQGWEVGHIYRDDSISATSGKVRPAFEKLLKRQEPRDVLVWDMDRLLRVNRDLERVVEAKMVVHSVRAGHIDLSNDQGLMVGRMATAVNTYEVQQKRARAMARYARDASEGKPFFHKPPLGHTKEGKRTSDAKHIEKAFSDLLSDSPPSLASIAREWNDHALPCTQHANAWTTRSVKQALLNPRVYGELVFRGEVMPVSLIEPLVTKDEFDALYGLLNDQSRGTKGPKKLDNLLSGIALCGRCADGTKVEATTAETVGGYGPVYRCPKGHNQHPRHEADAVVIGEVLNALEENPHIFDGEAEESVRVELASLRGLLLRWRDGASEMDPEEYLEVTRPLRARLMELEESHRDESLSALFEGLATSYSGMETLISDSLRLAEWWDSIGLLRQRALVSSLLNVTLMPRQRHSPGTHADYVKCRSAQS